ncbi:PepSY-associated TM helix domain-containing protein [Zhouia sp. PK063]|uniref:PepSY-associated TM helix domain-containing protein n=1 Tax=Zhouia sp. PK063 TaxID=3373602 RepID=UPI0037B6506C
MTNRNYNILFHLHTISGIIISVLLYVIFFAGSFSFFRDEIVNWERNDKVQSTQALHLNIDTALDTIGKTFDLKGRDITFRKYYEEQQISTNITASKDSLVKNAKLTKFLYLNTKNYTQENYYSSYSLGEFLYRLHFFAQVPYPYGYYLSGFTAFFFLFALITGILVHWDKIVSNFFLFRPKAKLKTLWTDMHTALGTIGFPFQFVYAVTGTFFMIKLLIVAPNVIAFYNGDQNKLYEALEYNNPTFPYKNIALNKSFNINKYVDETSAKWKDFNVTKVDIINYGDANMYVNVEGETAYSSKYTGIGKITYKVANDSIVATKKPYTETTYLDGVKNVLYRLHYGDYAGYPLRIISFIMGIIGCLVILSGVLIWLTARDKKHISEKKRKFNELLTRIYLAICLTMYPITALSFIAVKVIGQGMPFLYKFYFIGWLILTILFVLKKDNNFTNKYTLLLGSIFGICIPLVNGFATGNWFWKSYQAHAFHLFFVDVFWLALALITFFVYLKLVQKKKL